jgi:hypothetical protein
MNAIWDKFKWVLTHLAWFIAGLILIIDPKHIDTIIHNHPDWSGIILAIWTLLLSWANKTRPQPGQPEVSRTK